MLLTMLGNVVLLVDCTDNVPHDSGQTCPQLQAPELSNVLLKQFVDLLLVLLKSRECRNIKLGDDAFKLGLAELDHTLAQVA